MGRFFHEPGKFFVRRFLRRYGPVGGIGRTDPGDCGLYFGNLGRLIGILEIISGGDEFFYMQSGFRGEVSFEDPEISAVSLMNSPIDRRGPAIIGSQYEQPVAEFPVEVPQVFGCGPCAHVIVGTLVRPVTDFESEFVSGGRHELPGAFGADAGNGGRLKLGFDHGQIFQLQWEAIMSKNGIDDHERAFAAPFDGQQTFVVILYISGDELHAFFIGQ